MESSQWGEIIMSSRIIRAGDHIKALKIKPLNSDLQPAGVVSQESTPVDKDPYASGYAEGQRIGIELAVEVCSGIMKRELNVDAEIVTALAAISMRRIRSQSMTETGPRHHESKTLKPITMSEAVLEPSSRFE
jgi:hypothetical protein